jgi:DNA-directed RNA polymerase subunit M/transcription elongation factor TFIIS
MYAPRRQEDWISLQQQYVQMSDGELQALAADGYDLTEIARQALQAEIYHRRLDVAVKTQPDSPSTRPRESLAGDPHFTYLDLVPAYVAWELEKIRQAKRILEAAAIPSYVGPEGVEDVESFRPRNNSVIELKVRNVDLGRAREALATYLPRDSEPEGSEDSYVARCPKCFSSEIVFEGLDADEENDDQLFEWSCDGCGYRWKDDGVQKQA